MPRPAVRRLLTLSLLLLILVPLGLVLGRSVASARAGTAAEATLTNAGTTATAAAMASLARRMDSWIDPEFAWFGYPGSNPSSLEVEIRFCSEYSFDESTLVISRRGPEDEEGTDISSEFSWQRNNEGSEPGCEYELIGEGDVPLEMGTTTVEGTVCDTPMFFCGWVQGEYTIEDTTTGPPDPPPPPAIPVVSAVASTIGAPPGATGVTQRFLVRNRTSTQRTFSLTKTCVTPASSPCTGPTSVTLAASGDTTITITHTIASGSSGQTGIVTLSATSGSITGSDSVRVLVGPSAVSDTAGIDTTATRARDLCVMVAAGPGAAQCGDLVLAHALPSVRVLGTTRTPTLLYNSATAHPMVLLPVNAAFPSGASSVDAVLTIWNGITSHQSTTSFGSWTAGQVRRLVVGRDVASLNLATGVYPYTIEVRKLVSGIYSTVKTVSGEVAVVNRSQSPFGAGWWLAGLEELKAIDDTTKLWVGGDGSTRIYRASGGLWRARVLTRPDSMISLGGGQLCRRLPGNACVVFDSASGRHIATRGRLSMTGTNSWGFRTNFVYTGGRLAAIHIPHATGAGDSITFAYFNNGNTTLSQVTAPGVGSPRVVRVYTTGFRVDSVMDPDSTRVRWGYVGSTRRIGTHTSRSGRPTFFSYDPGGKLDQVRIPANPADTIKVALQALESRGYTGGSAGTPIEAAKAYTRIDGPRTDVPDSTLLWLNALGAPRQIRDALGFETALTYSATWPGLVTKVVSSTGFTTEATYDTKGRLATQTARNPYGSSPAQDAVTSYFWNGWDAIDSIIPAAGPRTYFGYDATTGNRTWQQVGPSSTRRVSFSYYPSGTHAGLLRSETSPTIAADTLKYDPVRGNLSEYLSPGPKYYRTRYVQDAIGRDTVVTAPLDTLQATHDSVFTTYDVMDRVTKSVTKAPDFAGSWQAAVVETEYDADGRPLSVTRSSVPDTAGVGELVTGTEYDWAGRAVAQLSHGTKDTMRLDQAGNVVWTKTRRGHELTMRYDALGRLIERVVPGVAYDRDEFVDQSIPVPFPFYPNNNRGLLIPPEVTRFWYDPAGQIRRAVNDDAEIVRSYYPNGQLKTDTLRIASTDRTTRTSYGMSRAYDLAGRDTSFTYPGATGRARYAYHDTAQGQLALVTAPDGDRFHFSWNAGGQLVNTTVTPSGGASRTFYDSLTYDSQGNIKTRKADRTAAANQTGWSGRHNETRFTDPRGRLLRVFLTPRFENEDPSQVDFQYHGLGALEQRFEDTAAEAEEWYADALGHRVWTRVPDAGRQGSVETESLLKRYTYDQDRLIRIEAVMEPLVGRATYPDTTGFQYDSAGNVVHEFTAMFSYSAAEPWTNSLVTLKKTRSWYGADEKLRVIQRYDATYGSSTTRLGTFEEYRYDPLGRRVMAWVRAGSDTLCNQDGCAAYVNMFVWNGHHLVQESYRANTNVYVHGLGIDKPLKIRDMIPHADYRGVYDAGNKSTGEAITSATANYPGRSYGAFREEGTPRLTKLYASLLQDGMDQSGLAYRRNRYYDPASGRFTQQDPIGLAGGLNSYGFAGGDPVNFVDPFGLKVCFRGANSQQLADSTAAATGTTFGLDANGCAENVQAVGGRWNDVSRGFAALATDTLFTFDMQYGGGGSRVDVNGITIDLGQVGNPYGTRRARGGCTTSPGANYDEASIIAHELGHAYAFLQGWTGNRDTRTAIGWENRIHRARGRPARSVQCH